MKIDRLLAILSILSRTNKITAPELAAQLEVSRRTISRDIDALCSAGYPIITIQGFAGGISLADEYKLNPSVLTTDELQNIIIALKSIESINDNANIESLLKKLAPATEIYSVNNSFLIDLGSHYKDSISKKTELFRTAIEHHTLVQFDYYSIKDNRPRTVEPYYIVFKWSSWYLLAYCIDSSDFRLFKLNRLWNVSALNKNFIPRPVPKDKLEFDHFLPDQYPIKVLFDASVEYKLIESYGPDSYIKTDDGKLLFERGYTNKNYMIDWLLSFGDKAKIIEPPEFITEIKSLSYALLELYKET